MALDPSYFFYSDGTITLTNGSDIATGTFTAWDPAVLPFDFVFPNNGTAGMTVIKEVIAMDQILLAKPWDGPTLTDVPYFMVRWTKHTDPKIYALRLSDYLTRLKAIPEDFEAVGLQVAEDAAAVASALTAITQAAADVDVDRQAVDLASAAIETAQTTTLEARDEALAARDVAVSAAGSTQALWDSKAAAQSGNIPAPVQYLRTAGYAAAGDGGDALYDRIAAPGTPQSWHFQSADGAWWQPVAHEWTPEMFGGNLQTAIDAAHALGGVVIVRSMMSAASILMRPGVKVLGRGASAGIVRSVVGAAGNLVDCDTYAAHGASLENLIIDGNRGNTYNPGAMGVRIGAANDVSVLRCTVKDIGGSGVYVTTGLRPKIKWNLVDNCGTYSIGLDPLTLTQTYGEVEGNTLTRIGMHAIPVTRAAHSVVKGNKILGHLIYGTRVNISGTTVTWVSGPRFTGSPMGDARPGNYLVANGGSELSIQSVESDTSLTVAAHSYGTLTNVPAGIGPGDHLGIVSAPYVELIENYIEGGAGCGVVIADDGTIYCDNVKIDNNTAFGVGSSGLSIQAGGKVRGTSFTNNTAKNCGRHGAAGHPAFNNGITLSGVSQFTYLDGNFNYDMDQTPATMQFGINLAGPAAGEVYMGKNPTFNAVNAGVGGAATVTLGAGWGSTASVSDLVSHGDSISFTITANGFNIAANPTFTINTVATAANSPPQPEATVGITATGGMLLAYVTAAAKTACSFTVFGMTPTGGVAYLVKIKL